MNTELWLTRLSRKVHPAPLAATGAALLLAMYALWHMTDSRLAGLRADLQSMTQAQEQSALALSHYQSLAELKTQDMNQFKAAMSNLAQSKKTLYEAGLSSQEERRLL